MSNSSDFQRDLSARLNQLYGSEGRESASIDSEGENRSLFELAVRIYCQRLGIDIYSSYYEGSVKENTKKSEQEEKEKWILDLCNNMLFSFDPPTDDYSQVDSSKFDWMVHVGSIGTEQEGIPYFSYLSRDSDTRLWQWQHPYEAFHRSMLREALQRYEQARQQTFFQARMLLGSRDGNSISDEETFATESNVANKLNRVETIFAQVLGVHIEEENASVLIDLAGELLNVLPSDWELGTVESEVGMLIPFFYDSLRGVSQWNHPFESQHRQMIVATRNDLTRQKKESRVRAQKAKELSMLVRERAREADELVRAELSTQSSVPPRTTFLSPPSKPTIGTQSLIEEKDEDDELEHKSEAHSTREKIVQQSSEPKIREDSTAVVEEKAQEVPKVEKSLPVVVTEAKVQQVEVYPLISKTFDTNADADAKSEDKTPALAELDEKSVVVTKIEDMVISPSKAQEVPTLAAEENSVVLSPPKADETMIHLEKDADHHNVIDDDMTSHYTDMGDEQSVFSHSETTLPPGADLPRENSLFDGSEVQIMQREVPCPEESVYSDDFSTLSKVDNISIQDSQIVNPQDIAETFTVLVKSSPADEEESYTEDFAADDATAHTVEINPSPSSEEQLRTESATVQVETDMKSTVDGEEYTEDFSTAESISPLNDIPDADEKEVLPAEPMLSPVSVSVNANNISDTVMVHQNETKDNFIPLASVVENVPTAENADTTTVYDEDFSPEEESVMTASISLERLALQLQNDNEYHSVEHQKVVSEVQSDSKVMDEPLLEKVDLLADVQSMDQTALNEEIKPSDKKLVEDQDQVESDFNAASSNLREADVTLPIEEETKSTASIQPTQLLLVSTSAKEDEETSYTTDFSSVADSKTREVSVEQELQVVSTELENQAIPEQPQQQSSPAIKEEDDKKCLVTPMLEDQTIPVKPLHQNAPVIQEEKYLSVRMENFHVHDLKDTGSFLNKQDPALSIKIGTQHFNTKRIKDGGTNARFPETFIFSLEMTEFDTNIELEVEVFNESLMGSKTHVGKGKAFLREWVKNFGSLEHVTVQLFHKGKKGETAKGTLSFQYVIEPKVEAIELAGEGEEIASPSALPQDTVLVPAPEAITVESFLDQEPNDAKPAVHETEVLLDSEEKNEISVIRNDVSVSEEDYLSDFSLEADSQVKSEADVLEDEQPVPQELLPLHIAVQSDFKEEEQISLKDAIQHPTVTEDHASLLQQWLEDERSLALSIESHPFWEPSSQGDVNPVKLQPPTEELDMEVAPPLNEPEQPKTTIQVSDAVAGEDCVTPQESFQKNTLLIQVEEAVPPKTELVEAEVLEIIPKVSFPDVPLSNESVSMAADVRAADIASRPVKLSAKHLFLMQNARKTEHSSSSPDLKPIPLMDLPSPKKKKKAGDAQLKWFHLGAYETNAEALRSRKIIKNLVINDSNGTIQVNPIINFHELFNSHSTDNKNTGGDEDSALLIIGRMNTDANKGSVKIVVRKNLSKMQWVVETDDTEVERIVQRHRRKRGLDGLNDDAIPVKPLKRAGASAPAITKAIRLEDSTEEEGGGGGGFASAESKGFGALLSQKMLADAAQKSKVRHNKYSDVVKENIGKYSSSKSSADKQYYQQRREGDEAPVYVRPKVDEVDCKLQKLKHLLLGSSTVPSSIKGQAGGAGLRSVKLPPIN